MVLLSVGIAACREDASPVVSDGTSDGEASCEADVVEPCECDGVAEGTRTCVEGVFGECECPETSACIDGVLAPGEDCDDNNTTPGDGCTAECTFESGTVLYEVDLGEYPNDVEVLSSGRVAVALDDFRVQVISETGAVAAKLEFPPPVGYGHQGSGWVTGLANGDFVVAFSAETGGMAADYWIRIDGEGEVVWADVHYGEGEPRFGLEGLGSHGDALYAAGFVGPEADGQRVVRRYDGAGQVVWETETPGQARSRVVVAATEDEVQFDFIPFTGSETFTRGLFDPDTGALRSAVSMPIGWRDIGDEGAGLLTGMTGGEPGSISLVMMTGPSADELWRVTLPLYSWVTPGSHPNGVSYVGGIVVVEEGQPGGDSLFGIDGAGTVINRHALGDVVGVHVGPDGLLYLEGDRKLIKFAP